MRFIPQYIFLTFNEDIYCDHLRDKHYQNSSQLIKQISRVFTFSFT